MSSSFPRTRHEHLSSVGRINADLHGQSPVVMFSGNTSVVLTATLQISFYQMMTASTVIGVNERDCCALIDSAKPYLVSKTFLSIIMLISCSACHSVVLMIYFSIHLLHLHLEFTEFQSCVTVCHYTNLPEMYRNVCSCQCQLVVEIDDRNLQCYISYIQTFK